MTEGTKLIEVMEARAKRRDDRRAFFKMAATAAVAAPLILTLDGRPLHAQSAPSDGDILNFALNLEYLEAQFYYFAFFGTGLPANNFRHRDSGRSAVDQGELTGTMCPHTNAEIATTTRACRVPSRCARHRAVAQRDRHQLQSTAPARRAPPPTDRAANLRSLSNDETSCWRVSSGSRRNRIQRRAPLINSKTFLKPPPESLLSTLSRPSSARRSTEGIQAPSLSRRRSGYGCARSLDDRPARIRASPRATMRRTSGPRRQRLVSAAAPPTCSTSLPDCGDIAGRLFPNG